MAKQRTGVELLADHIELRKAGNVASDLAQNYSTEVVLLTRFGLFHGHEGVRRVRALCEGQFPRARYRVRTLLAEGEVAFVEWCLESPGQRLIEGATSYVIRGGKIVVETAHFGPAETVEEDARTPGPSPLAAHVRRRGRFNDSTCP